jgi:outer membrane protein assembly factor BamB
MKSRKFVFLYLVLFLFASSSIAQSKYTNLQPSKEYDWGIEHRRVYIKRLPQNRKLAVVGDTLYLLDSNDKVVWRWSTEGAEISHDLLVDPAGNIYITGTDNLWASVDLKTGKEKWQEYSNGTAPFSLIGLYEKNKYVIVHSFWYYRHYKINPSARDVLSIGKGDTFLWETDIPNDAVIKIRGKNIYAITRRKGKPIWKNIPVPAKFKKPVRKAR